MHREGKRCLLEKYIKASNIAWPFVYCLIKVVEIQYLENIERENIYLSADLCENGR